MSSFIATGVKATLQQSVLQILARQDPRITF